VILVIASAVMLAVAFLAAMVPARRAASTNPVPALHSE
jgi:ABC-type lipoprotein release transport system permease subunit